MPQPTPPATGPVAEDPYLDARRAANELSDTQVTAALMQGQQIGVTVRLKGNSKQIPGTVQVRGAVGNVVHTPAPRRQVITLELETKTTVYDGRLREVMLTLWGQHSAAAPDEQRVLAGVITLLETVQKLDVPEAERDGL